MIEILKRIFAAIIKALEEKETIFDNEKNQSVKVTKSPVQPKGGTKELNTKLDATKPAPKPVVLPDVKKPLVKKKQVDLAIVVGHNSYAQGASFNLDFRTYPKGPRSEFQFHSVVSKYIKEQCDASGHINTHIIFRDVKTDVEGAYKRAEALGCDLLIELHYNAFNEKASGTETLASYRTDDVNFATVVQKHLCVAFNRTGMSRGVKSIPQNQNGGYAVHRLIRVPNCLTEAFFGDNRAEATFAWENKTTYANALRNAVLEYARKEKMI